MQLIKWTMPLVRDFLIKLFTICDQIKTAVVFVMKYLKLQVLDVERVCTIC